MGRKRDDDYSHSTRDKRRRERSPVIHHSFTGSLDGSLPTTSLMGSLLAKAKAKAEETATKENLKGKPKVGSMTAIANAAADMLKASRSTNHGIVGKEGALNANGNVDKDAEFRLLDIEMQKRRERIDRWRRERKLKQDILAAQQRLAESSKPIVIKKWNLEDDDDEDENLKKPSVDKNAEPDIDPLDAYMQEVHEKIRTKSDVGDVASSKVDAPSTEKGADVDVDRPVKTNSEKVAKKRIIGRGELMENNDVDDFDYEQVDNEAVGPPSSIEDALAMLQRKDKMPMVDHAAIQYESFRKNFYIEVPELAKMTKENVKKVRMDLENIRIRGKNCPKPLRNWVQAGISSRLLATLKRNKFEKPTPIQCQALPVIMSGRDVIGIAKTGSGKTLAFVIPLMRHLEYQSPLKPGDGPISIILTPTRELALQIYKEIKKLCQSTDVRVICVYGGTGISEQIGELRRGAEIVVCTPGRMIDMLTANGGRVTNLKRCTYLVLDEADRMFDLGFEPQVMRIIENIRPDRQTLMFSATFPRQMELLARKALTEPIEIQVGGRSVVCSDVEQHALILPEEDKVYKLLELLGVYQEQGCVLIFVEKQESADELMRILLRYGYPCMSLHGGIDQYDRDSVITDFKKGDIRLLIATSVAARGLDVAELVLVVNYDCPNHYEDYVHRCGRTGRAGRKGFAYTFLTPDQERQTGDVVRAFTQSGQKPPEELVTHWNEYKARMASEGKKVYGTSGFRGKGFLFDESEAQLNNEKRRFQKAVMGLQDSDDEEEPANTNADDWDSKIEGMFATQRKYKDALGIVVNASESVLNEAKTVDMAQASQAVVNAALVLARKKAALINFKTKTQSSTNGSSTSSSTTNTTSATITANVTAVSVAESTSSVSAPASASLTLAEQAAERLHAKLGYSKQNANPDSDGEDDLAAATTTDSASRFEEELIINDFPQNVRWRITGREMLNHLGEYCDVGVSVRGIYMPPAKAKTHVPESNDDRPLYLFIEAVSERQITLAKKEIMRIIKEELIRLQSSSSINRGRYKVV